MTTEQKNETIALFDGYKIYDEGSTRCVVNEAKNGFPVSDLRYHESWNWLMPVVKRALDFDAGMSTYQLYLSDSLRTADMETIYNALYDFIESTTSHI